MSRYNPAVIEAKWREYWETNQTFAAPKLPTDLPNNPQGKKAYVLDMFPYPSAQGLHVGHPEGYTATDIYCRFMRMNGYAVMHPMGWDAFGLPAEQHAKKTGIHPRITTEKNIDNFRRQLKMLGFSYDWSREVATTDVDYFKWTQYIFLLIYNSWYDANLKKARPIEELPIPDDVQAQGDLAVRQYIDDHRLAYQIEAPVNWCAELGTVLANEEVVGGVSERGGYPVVRMPLRQWMLRITAYADRLEEDLKDLDWSESVKTLQRNWIGKSTGAEVDFYIGEESSYEQWRANRAQTSFPRKPDADVLRVFTTRPDTLFGASYMVVAPEHPQIERLTTQGQKQVVEEYRKQASYKSELDRTDLAKEKTGVFTGSYAINPVSGQKIPIWTADYVLASYGTGAIMAVPAHDTRDFEFAKQFDLPIRQVVKPDSSSSADPEKVALLDEPFVELGLACNSGQYDGTPSAEFKVVITEDLSAKGLGRKTVNYKLRDWLFSRQHFWGEPFPLLRELDENGNPNGAVLPLDPSELPLDIPHNLEFNAQKHSPEPPLENAPSDWLYIERNGKKYKRETNTMPQWAGSCWYYLRFLDPHNDQRLVDPEVERAWTPVDLYIGGAEHAVLHLLYARFWHKILFDYGLVSTSEPFQRLVNQGMILGEMEFTAYQDANGSWVSADDVEERQGALYSCTTGATVTPVKIAPKDVGKNGTQYVLTSDSSIVVLGKSEKMSKSRGNVINPDDVVEQYGADSLRLYEMFMGPLESVKPWNQDGVNGVRNFLDRAWRMIVTTDHDSNALSEALTQDAPTEEQDRVLNKTIKLVTEDVRNLSYNTAIARMMEFVNYFGRQTTRPIIAMRQFVLLLSPFAPHIAEELWQILGGKTTLAYEPWPTWNEDALKESRLVIPVSINGKLRARIEIDADADVNAMEQIALNDARIKELIADKTIVKKIVVPKKMVNIVVK
ncbi:MAG: leucine--tRNA ligase [Planctomycetia bacterium]|nr:leucine--tRNA ligase [Planctomycetia bacterium]